MNDTHKILIWRRTGGNRRNKLKSAYMGLRLEGVSNYNSDYFTVRLKGITNAFCRHASEYQIDLDRETAIRLRNLLNVRLETADKC